MRSRNFAAVAVLILVACTAALVPRSAAATSSRRPSPPFRVTRCSSNSSSCRNISRDICRRTSARLSTPTTTAAGHRGKYCSPRPRWRRRVGPHCALAGGQWVSPVRRVRPRTIPRGSPSTTSCRSARPGSPGPGSGHRDPQRLPERPRLPRVTGRGVDADTLAAKGDRQPMTWLPPAKSYDCTYLASWVAVKWRWNSLSTAPRALSSPSTWPPAVGPPSPCRAGPPSRPSSARTSSTST